jgi:hypothetical protein
MHNIGNGLGNNEASIRSSYANGVGPMNARARFFNPYPFDKYAFG